MNNKLINGAFWISFGSIFSRALGVLYLIPWLMMIGNRQIEAQAIFNSAYVPYSLFLSLGTAGFPTAMAKNTAFYNSQKQYSKAGKLLFSGGIIMLLSGLVMALILYFLAPALANMSPVKNIDAAVQSIRWLAPAVFIIPVMSYLRGFYQGNSEYKIFGISQIVEQFTRVIFILLLTYIFLVVKGDFYFAISMSTFAAAIGAVASLLHLLFHAYRNRSDYEVYLQNNLNIHSLFAGFGHDVKQILADSIPFIIVGSATVILQLIDQFTFKPILRSVESIDFIQNEYTLFSANPGKVTLVVIAISVAISGAVLPIISGAKQRADVKAAIIDNFKIEFRIMIPVIGLFCVIAKFINIFLFQNNPQGEVYLAYAIYYSLFMGLFINVETVIQSMGKHGYAIKILLLGLIVKVVSMYPLTRMFNGFGAIVSTGLATAIPFFVAFMWLLREFDIRVGDIFNPKVIRVIITTIVMAVVVFGIVTMAFNSTYTKFQSLLISALLGAIYVIPFIWVERSTFKEKIISRLKNKHR